MKEFIAQALVLGCTERRNDRTADLFTLELGRGHARMVGGAAITSIFSAHCSPLNLLTTRLVKKNRYTLADAVTEDRFTLLRHSRRAFAEGLEALFALRTLLADEEPDPRLFHEVRRALEKGALTVRGILALLGVRLELAIE